MNTESWNRKLFLLIAICALSAISAPSDNLFIVQSLLPLATALLLIRFVKRTSVIPFHLIFAPVVASGLGVMIFRFTMISSEHAANVIGFDKVRTNLISQLSILSEVYTAQPVVAVYAIGFYLLSQRWARSLDPRKRETSGLLWTLLLSFIFLSAAATALATIVVQNLPVAPRYFIPFFTWPIIAGSILLTEKMQGRSLAIVVAICMAGAISLAGNARKLYLENGFSNEFYPPAISCIDRALAYRGLSNGIAPYWEAKHIQAFSKKSLNLAPHQENLTEFRWITSDKVFKQAYDFAITGSQTVPGYRLNVTLLEDLNGKPSEVLRCGERTLLIYGHQQLVLSGKHASPHAHGKN